MANHSIQPVIVDSVEIRLIRLPLEEAFETSFGRVHSRYFERDVIVPEVRVAADGTAEVPPGPGLGFAVDLDYIERCTETVERIGRKS